MPNAFAYTALAAWPIVAFFLFRAMSRPAALIWTIVAGYLLLPPGVGIELPMVPSIDKGSVPALSAALLCFVAARRPPLRRSIDNPAAAQEAPAESPAPAPVALHFHRREPSAPEAADATSRRPARMGWLERLLLAAMVLGPIGTALQNSDPITMGVRWLPGLSLYDGLSMAMGALIIVVPYLLARRFLTTEKEHVLLLSGLCIAALAYSLPTLFEVRMSPQLSNWVYGFLYQSFLQSVRDEGFRPAVFLQHGLWLALFVAMGVVAAVALGRQQPQRRGTWLAATAWLLVTLVLCRSLGALATTLFLLPVAAFLPTRPQLLLAGVIAAVVLAYPALREFRVIPVTDIAAVAQSISADRAQSFTFRLENEDALLARAGERPLTGWGGWGRSRVFDLQSGKDISVTDGSWIIALGSYGWLGYLGQFGLLTLPVLLLAFRDRRRQVSFATAGLCLILAANLIDLIPNATLTPVTWLVAGAIMGRASARPPAAPKADPSQRYVRVRTGAADYGPARRRTPATSP